MHPVPPIPARPDMPGPLAHQIAGPPSPSARSGLRFVASALVLAMLPAIVAATVLFAGDPAPSYAFLNRTSDGSPSRWDPCTPITYELNLTNAPASALDDVLEALDRVRRASGLRFTLVGITERTPQDQEAAGYLDGQGRALPILISWVPKEEFESYADPRETIAVGYPYPLIGGTYRSGLIVINADAGLRPGFGDALSLGPVLMHEVGHVLGLAHVRDGAQIMWSPDVPGSDAFPKGVVTRWGDGDREGLRRVGRAAGCIR